MTFSEFRESNLNLFLKVENSDRYRLDLFHHDLIGYAACLRDFGSDDWRSFLVDANSWYYDILYSLPSSLSSEDSI